jgi:16S rRNA (uracil1498-N3)-methyltransferase
MSLPLFFHAYALQGKTALLDENNARHAIQVLRMQPGQALELTDGKGNIFTGEIQEAGKKKCLVTILSQQIIPRLNNREVGIAISPVKNAGRFEWFLEKATELGIKDIYPIICTRTEKIHLRTERMEQILISAMLQSKQAWLPQLHPVMPFETYLGNNSANPYKHCWIAHCVPHEKHSLAKAIQPGMQDSLLLIGPEGDFT